MAGIPNRKKAISLIAISTPGDVKTYPTGTYCVPADGDGTFLLSDSTVSAQFSWSSGSAGSISYDKTTGATNITTLTASNAYVVNTLAVGNYIQLLPVNNVIPSNTTASYIYMSGSTNDIYFSQYKPSSSIANTSRLRWLEGTLESGLLHGGRLSTVNGTTTFNIADGSGIIVSTNAGYDDEPYPSIKYVQWNAFVSQSLPSIGSSQITYIALDSSGSIVRSSIPFSDGDFMNYIVLGRILHQTGSVTNGAATVPNVAYGSTQNKIDFFRAFGPLKLTGHTLSASGSTLGLLKDAGTSFAIGRNYTVDPNMPNYISATTDTALTSSKIYREYVSGSTLILDTGIGNAGYAVIDPTKRLDSTTGLLATVPAGKYTTQRAFWFPNSINKALHVYYGNTEYNSLDTAQAGISTESFVEDRYTSTEAIFLGYIIVKANASSLANAADAKIIQAGFARGIGGGGGGGSAASGTPIGPAGGDLSGSYPDPTLAIITTASTAGSSTYVPIITIDAKGRVTTLSSASIQIAESQVTNLETDLLVINTNYNNLSSSYYPLSSSFVLVSSSLNSLSSSYYPLSSSFVTLSSSVNTISSSLAAVSSSNNNKVSKTGDTMTGNLIVSGAYIGVGGTPTTQIDVINASAGTNANFRVRGDAQGTAAGNWFLDVFSGVSGHGFYGYGAKSMLFGTSGSTRVTIDSTGKVGVGTTAPLYVFHISTGYAKSDTTQRSTYFLSSNDVAGSNPFGGLFSIQGAAALSNRLFDISTTDYNSAWGGNLILQRYGGNVGIRTSTTVPSAYLQIAAGTATAGTAPLKFTSGTNLSSVESGSMEYDGTYLYFSPVATRKIVTYRKNVITASAALTASVDSCVIASGSFTITLPNPSTVGNGAEIKVKKSSTGFSTVTISASAGTIDGVTTQSLTTQYSSYTFISDGSTNWWII